MQSLLILLGLVVAGITQTTCVEEDALEDASSFMQLPARLQNRLQSRLQSKSKLAKVRQAKRAKSWLRPAPAAAVGETAEWPTPDDPDIKITDEDRAQVKTFKEAVDTKNVTLINSTIGSMALMPVELDIEEGVYDYIFQVLRDYQADEYQYVQQHAWRGLSDQSGTERGAALIANFGGPNKGVEYMVDQLLVHPFDYGYCADQLTVQYEILMCLSGLLITDSNNTRGPAAVEAGLVPAVMRSLMGEPEHIATQHTACQVVFFLLARNPQYAKLFHEAGADLYIKKAVERFKDGDDTPFMFGFTLGEFYDIGVCAGPLMLLGFEDLKDEYAAGIHDWKPWQIVQW